MTDIDLLAATAYESGIDPIDYAAENVIQAHIDARDDRRNGTGLPASAVARMIIADLMNAGWKAPEVTG